jgi:hypothetical protein
MRQPCLMKLNITNMNENCLSSDIVFIALANFFNSPHRSLQYAIQFCLIDTLQNLLQELKEIGPRQPPESVRVFHSQ